MNYIEKEETINLVVIPSNVDIATTEALRMAQEVDPKGDRTIGEEQGLMCVHGRLWEVPLNPGALHTQREGTCTPLEELPSCLQHQERVRPLCPSLTTVCLVPSTALCGWHRAVEGMRGIGLTGS